MKISERFQLGKSQVELDFVDIDPDRDTPLYLSPHSLGYRSDAFSIEAHRTIESFFRFFLDLIRAGEMDHARGLFEYLHEPNETCLGISSGNPNGRGVGRQQAQQIFDSIIQSRAVQTGVVEHLEDCRIFIHGIDKDKVSDMTTNIIRGSLVKYTQQQCFLHGIPLRPNTATGPCWIRENSRWEESHDDMLVIDDAPILLVPKGVVGFAKAFGMSKYHQHFVLDFLKQEQLQTNGPFVRRRQLRNGGERVWVSKKEIKEGIAPAEKDFVTTFTVRHREVFTGFREWAARSETSLSDDQIQPGLDLAIALTFLRQRLPAIPVGNDGATAYHRLVTGILEAIFYPMLISPSIEREIHDGRKRIDIVFDNAADGGIFSRLHRIHHMPCQYIAAECKNYGREVGNPEVDQLSGRFSPNRGQVGILLCRSVENMDLLMRRCRDTYADNRGLIIPLTDDDLLQMLDEKIADETARPEDQLLGDRIRDIILR
ncbi:hypothetical protein [Burkholderia pseudomultivorans]|uniref:hypothetical protein n=1 Tax=Burkholderia pseudomultivorans TaxID=1207504 RepID=UPI000841DEDC|nr:hypothetical protein [Burkholderia pseudomultivorans]AOI91448.1 hypothetical protein WS57_22020 [Burkholderia pseudomultivorans]